jgi:type I restriction-modification system DNA methylase subunit
MLGKIASAGQNGQFRTPRHIIRLMVEMVEPTPKCTSLKCPDGFVGGTQSPFAEFLRRSCSKQMPDET